MDDTRSDLRDDQGTGAAIGRRAFFSRTLLAAGAVTGLLMLTGCPGSDGDDDDDDDGGDDD
ncbi:hypothetical protein [Actinoplanes friuliensis]|jgi:hypothetical protein|uniref:Uncharacterized protein n=1 Tax=Actinoplanes friuliensis DSM 7358 TaxID=1246995 RepID=U5W0I6_9ACTN|nr:hypothetical protein [Actinoplanes friuliensis]AGZ41500.1 hypothetical protein AFR_16090 [Actinoplanes friuliensis DSM 7358]